MDSSPELTPVKPAPPFTDPLFAAQAAEKSHAVQAARKLLERDAVAFGLPDDPWLRERIKAAREKIIIIEKLVDMDTDPKSMAFLAGALSKVIEIERTLSGRALPGTLKPVAIKVKRPTFDGPN